MRIALIADTFVPTRTSAAVQLYDLARELVVQGHHPTVIAPSTSIDSAWAIQMSSSVEEFRVRAPRTKDVGRIRRALAEFLLPFYLLRAILNGPLRSIDWDGIVWYSPSIFLTPIVAVLKIRSRCRAYLILRDIFPEWAVDTGLMRRGPAYYFFKGVEHFQYAVADVIGVQTKGNLPYLARWAVRPNKRVEVLLNWLSERGHGQTDERDTPPPQIPNKKFVFVYAGNMGHAQDMGCLIDLASRFRDVEGVGFLFIGRGTEVPRMKAIVSAMALGNVAFLDEVAPDEIPGLLARCYVGLIALDTRHKTHNIPGKFLAYLQAGLPVLARINPGNDLESLINDNGLGRASTTSIDALVDTAIRLIASPAERDLISLKGRQLAKTMFSTAAAVRQVVHGLR